MFQHKVVYVSYLSSISGEQDLMDGEAARQTL